MNAEKENIQNSMDTAKNREYIFESPARSLFFFHKNNKSEPMLNLQKVRIILFWWRRRESNPRPKANPYILLRVQAVV